MIQPVSMNAVAAPVYLPSLTAARTRTGMRNISELVDCLIRYYEAQAKCNASETGTHTRTAPPLSLTGTASVASGRCSSSGSVPADRQVTFDWYDANGSKPGRKVSDEKRPMQRPA